MRLWLALALLAVGVPGMAATRVVSLAPSLSEMVVELGASDLLVGRLDAGEPLPELAMSLQWAAMASWTWSVWSACNRTCSCYGRAVSALRNANNCAG